MWCLEAVTRRSPGSNSSSNNHDQLLVQLLLLLLLTVRMLYDIPTRIVRTLLRIRPRQSAADWRPRSLSDFSEFSEFSEFFCSFSAFFRPVFLCDLTPLTLYYPCQHSSDYWLRSHFGSSYIAVLIRTPFCGCSGPRTPPFFRHVCSCRLSSFRCARHG